VRRGGAFLASVGFVTGARKYFLRRWRRKFCAACAGSGEPPLGFLRRAAKILALPAFTIASLVSGLRRRACVASKKLALVAEVAAQLRRRQKGLMPQAAVLRARL